MFPDRREILDIILGKAKELGRELRNTEEYQRLDEVNQRLNKDSEAQEVIKAFQEAQSKIQFSQQSGVQPTQEQIDDYKEKQKSLEANLTVKAYMKATEGFYAVMKKINETITAAIEGITD
jgi:cell fate (sporulation/competence/biofilm development) regulator YlbF (YheA/YmcA/DUF963 family)